mmetsp:Transcript_3896/g.4653  ORF Transcript_3896/g.4653 Transcript_3896/m.4653 type:complete len:94 (+) Transcript_3896:98-379(+)
MSFVTQLMAPGGGVMLLPFVKIVIGCLLLVTLSAFAAGVARIHMAILSFLSGGLLFSLYFFEIQYAKVKGNAEQSSGNGQAPADSSGKQQKTD